MAWTSSLNCLSCRNPYQTPHSMNASLLSLENLFYFSLAGASSHPLPPNRLQFPPLYTGRFGSFFVLCILALGGHCLQMLCLPGFGTHANTQNLPHFRAFPASIQEHSPRNAYFSWQTQNCQIVPVMPSYIPPPLSQSLQT